MLSKPLSLFTKQKPYRIGEIEDFICFDLKYDFLERFYNKESLKLTLTSARNLWKSTRNEKMAEGSFVFFL